MWADVLQHASDRACPLHIQRAAVRSVPEPGPRLHNHAAQLQQAATLLACNPSKLLAWRQIESNMMSGQTSDQLLASLAAPDFVASDVGWTSTRALHADIRRTMPDTGRVDSTVVMVPYPDGLRALTRRDGTTVVLHHLNAWEQGLLMFADPAYADCTRTRPDPQYDRNGKRVFNTFMSGEAWPSVAVWLLHAGRVPLIGTSS